MNPAQCGLCFSFSKSNGYFGHACSRFMPKVKNFRVRLDIRNYEIIFRGKHFRQINLCASYASRIIIIDKLFIAIQMWLPK